MRRASSPFVHAIVGVATASLLALLPLVEEACVTTDATTTIVPITGFTVRAESLVAARGCGIGATQVYKYAVLVSGTFADGSVGPMQLGLFDCFADGVFVNLPAYPLYKVPAVYPVEVFAFDQAMFAALPSDIAARLAASDSTLSAALLAPLATWTSQCTGTEVLNVESLAVCGPLLSTGAGAALVSTGSFAAFVDGGAPALVCGTDYASVSGEVQVVSSDLASLAPTPLSVTPTPCGGSVSIAAPVVPARVDVTIDLLSAGGATVGSAHCTGVALPNQPPNPLTCVLTSGGSASADGGSPDASADAGPGDAALDAGAPDGAPVADAATDGPDGPDADAALMDATRDAPAAD